jgi:hypothetical protein
MPCIVRDSRKGYTEPKKFTENLLANHLRDSHDREQALVRIIRLGVRPLKAESLLPLASRAKRQRADIICIISVPLMYQVQRN